MLIRSMVALALACLHIWLLTPQPSLAASLTQAKTTSQKKATKQFSVADAFGMQSASLRTLMLELYECNPQDLQKSTKVSKEEFVQWVFEGPFFWKFDAIRNVQSVDALTLSFSSEYRGDRVLPFITGLYTMQLLAYGGKMEYLFPEKINPQKLYIAAQNIKIGSAKLLRAKLENDEPYISNHCSVKIKKNLDDIFNNTNHDAQTISKEIQLTTNQNLFDMTQIEDISSLEFIHF
jgi:hypothetical protein